MGLWHADSSFFSTDYTDSHSISFLFGTQISLMPQIFMTTIIPNPNNRFGFIHLKEENNKNPFDVFPLEAAAHLPYLYAPSVPVSLRYTSTFGTL